MNANLGLAAAMLLFGNSLLFSQSEEKKNVSADVTCTDLDFLLGSWDVTREGSPAIIATGTFQSGASNHCYVTLSEKSPRIGDVLCFFAYSNASHDWQQLCGSTTGGRPFYYNGVRHGDEISFLVEDLKDPTVRHRFSFILQPDGTVREIQLNSKDNGKSWPETGVGLVWKKRPAARNENQQ